MANYTAPLCDIQFVLGNLPDIYRLDQNLPRHENNFLVAKIMPTISNDNSRS